ncbi:MAG TPA: RNA methyltransferase, partial [Terriglobales bacterium]|nr:RNA methyltransferase [Terriglobales bacterium]
RIVLARPKGAANVGAVARAMKNMGLADLVLAAPETMDPAWARSMSKHAVDVLERARRTDSLRDAVGDCAVVFGTTARDGDYRSHPLSPRQAGATIVRAAAADRVAVVFGPEDHGLSNEDLLVCDQLIHIPTHAAYSSLNLAQAVLVCAYEIFLAEGEAQGWDWQAERPRPAPAANVQFLLERLQQAFLDIGFLSPDNPEHIMHTFRRILGRAQLQEREVKILLGLARQIGWYGRQGAAAQPPVVE